MLDLIKIFKKEQQLQNELLSFISLEADKAIKKEEDFQERLRGYELEAKQARELRRKAWEKERTLAVSTESQRIK